MITSRLALGAKTGGAPHAGRSFPTERPAREPIPEGGRRIFSRLTVLAAAITFFLVHAEGLAAPAINLQWDTNPETDISSYELSYGTSAGIYTATVNVGKTPSATVTGLNAGSTYYFVVAAYNQEGQKSPASAEISYQLPAPTPDYVSQVGWTLKSVDSEETPAFAASAAFDGDPSTFWHTRWSSNITSQPHDLQINMGTARYLSGFRYLPRQDNYAVGNIAQFEFYVSMDGVNWGSPVASGTFADSSTEKEILFSAKRGQFIRLRSLSEISGGNFTSVAELRVLEYQGIVANQAPTATAGSTTTAEDIPVAILLSGSDPNGDPLTYSIITSPSKGTLSGTPPNLIYTPQSDSNGNDSFTFKTRDGSLDSTAASVSITVTAVNDAPFAVSKSVATPEDTPLPIVITGSDPENATLAFAIVAGPSHGELIGTPPNLTYNPSADFNGSDQFSFRTSDRALNSAPATISITVTPVGEVPGNVAPAFGSNPIVASATEDSAISGELAATDANPGDTLIYSKLSGPSWLSISPAGELYGTPLNGNVGLNTFSVKVTDPSNAFATASLLITVANTNDAPVFKSNPTDFPSGSENESYFGQTLGGEATDPDAGDTLNYSKTSGPAWLIVSSNGTLGGTPPANSKGLHRFTVRATDSAGAFGESTLQIEILENRLPLPWSVDRLGEKNLLGGARYASGRFTLTGSGALAKTQDAGNFGWQTLTGDGRISARVIKLDNVGKSSLVGIMIRESLAPNSRQAFIGADKDGDYSSLHRTKTGGTTSAIFRNNKFPTRIWLRLIRKGDIITAFKSSDGQDWEQLGKPVELSLPKNCYVGLAVSSGNNSQLSTSTFSNVSVTP